jgi:uncharacterized FlaG/YvyC family protein
MAEQVTTNIGSNGIYLASVVSRIEQVQAAKVTAPRSTAAEGSGSARSEKGDKASSSKAETRSSQPLGDVSLKFEIDRKTHDVTILILDRSTRQVVRTIPPDEMSKMDPGELLQLFA